ncbi:MAG: hypothetical protein JO061_02900 [Acidobacteriaceae bacterium]|nr:hypothetical protein [Acidobacteriaceae bacterium]
MRYRVHRIKETPGENFRWSPHAGGTANVKPKDYESSEEVAAATVYAAWKLMRENGPALRPGDLLEALDPVHPSLQIVKFIGFEPAQWIVPEPKGLAVGVGAEEHSAAAEKK